jgi:hypothetical protein
MKRILFLFITAVAINATAQDSKIVQSAGYSKNDKLYYQVTGCVPASTVEIYSEPGGGKIVATAVADLQGVALVEIPSGSKYAFALNTSFANSKGIKGNGYITELKEPVLTARSFTVTDAGKPSLQWEITSKNPEVTCDILRNDDLNGYKKIGTVSKNLHPENKFIFSDVQAEGTGAVNLEYDIIITDAANKLQFTLGSKKIEKEFISTAKVYPSLFTDAVTIEIPDNITGTLTAFNNAGIRVYSVNVKPGTSKLDLSRLAAASYLVKISDNNNKVIYRGKIVKSN